MQRNDKGQQSAGGPDIPKAYDPGVFEKGVYDAEEQGGIFNPDCAPAAVNREPFSIILPPPNVTGTLHIGHATMLAIEDIMTRFMRMQGRDTVWVPGLDHAAIATQNVVEKKINKGLWNAPLYPQGTTRHDLGREKFLGHVGEFVEESKNTIHRQVRAMGASLDWSREAYTMDAGREQSVYAMFKMLFADGLMYRGTRVVNWCPTCASTLAEDELEYVERPATLYTFRYAADFPFAISSTRPETKLGDMAVAVHPTDKRYKKYIGKKYRVQFMDRPLTLKIVADRGVDPAFGTGALGVTPAHSATDEEIARKNKLPSVAVIDERGQIDGVPAVEMRERVAAWLRSAGLMEKEESITQSVPVCYRCGTVVEPLPKEQWFIAVEKPFKFRASTAAPVKGIRNGKKITLKQLMRHVVATGQTRIIPDRFEKTYFNWIDNLRDWCVSRQIWFGHRVPVWYCIGCAAPAVLPHKKRTVHIIRHGETDWNKMKKWQGHADIPLNDTGRAQARAAAAQLKDRGIDLIISSDLKRAHETAQIIGAELGCEVITDAGLRERHYGEFEGVIYSEKSVEFVERFRIDPDFTPAGGESLRTVEARVMEALNRHLSVHAHKNIAVVSHGSASRTLVAALRQIAPEKRKYKFIPNASVISFDLCAPCSRCGNEFFEQDPDTLDTWFSSGLWTFSTLGWPCPRVWYVRHGECDGNVQGYYDADNLPQNVLTKKGAAQADAAAQFLKDKHIDVIYTSPLKRTQDTARRIAKRTGAKIIVDKRITELYMGAFEGKHYTEWKQARGGKNYRDVGDAFLKQHGAETYGELRARAYDFLREINEKHRGQTIVVVSHQATITQLLSYGKQIDPQDAWDIFKHRVGNAVPLANDLARFHPTSVLETGYDILFFWVARMIMLSMYALGEVPFRDVYLHGLVRDKDGDKMSKSKPETVIDPLPVAETYGTDAVRLSLVIGTSAGNDFKLWEEKIAGFRNFTNKLWNIARFMMMNGARISAVGGVHPQGGSTADAWILTEYARTHRMVTDDLAAYRFSHAGETLRDFTWGSLADWYLESIKTEMRGGVDKSPVLSYLFEALLKLWHPFMPLVTETLWRMAGGVGLLAAATWPAEPGKDAEHAWQAGHAAFEKEKQRITAERQEKAQPMTPEKRAAEVKNMQTYIAGLEAMLNNKDFTRRAPAAVIAEKQAKLAQAKEDLVLLQSSADAPGDRA